MANSVPPKGERRQGTGKAKPAATKPTPKPKSMMAATAKPKPAAKPAAKPASAERRQGSMPRPAERRQGASPAAKPAESKAYSKYRQDALDYMAKVPGGTAQYAGELQRLQKEGSYDKRYGQSPNQRAADVTAARKKTAAKNPAEKAKANRNRGADL